MDNEDSVSLNTIPNSEIDDHPPQHKRSKLTKSSIAINPVPAKKSKHSPGRTPHAEKWGSYAKENVYAELFCICRQKEDRRLRMIKCCNDECDFKWFHFNLKCVNIEKVPINPWYCNSCL